MKTYTLEEIKAYLHKQSSFGDAIYYLSEKTMEEANKVIHKCPDCAEDDIDSELIEFEDYFVCDDCGYIKSDK